MKRPPLVTLSPGLALLAACSDHSGFFARRAPALQVVAFETRAEVLAGVGDVADVAAADFDGDGLPDLAVTSLRDRVQILLGQGGGQFGIAQSIDLPGAPAFVAAADIDRDGDADVVVVRAGSGIATTLVNDGRGGFAVGRDNPVGGSPQELVVADLDGDGRVDILTSSLGAPALTWLRGNGDGTFTVDPRLDLGSGAEPLGIAAADLDSDGIVDVVATDHGNARIAVFYGRGQGLFEAPLWLSVGQTPVAVTIADVSHDGLADLVVSNLGAQSLAILRRTGPRQYATSFLPTDGPPGLIVAGDLTGDRVADLVVCVFSRASLSLYPGRADGGLGEEIQMGTSGLPFRPLLLNVNPDLDPHADLVVSGALTDRLSVLFGSSGLPATAFNYKAGVPSAEAVAAADFDGDGVAELAVAGTSHASVAINAFVDREDLRVRELTPMLAVPLPRRVVNVVRGDFDHDGRPDLAVAMYGGVKLLANRSAPGRFAFEPVPAGDGLLLANAGPFEIAAGDLDGDGFDDLVTSSLSDNKLCVLRAAGAGLAFEPTPQVHAVPGRPLGLAIADFDGDGDLDVAVSRFDDGYVNVYANDGRAGLSVLAEVPVGAAPNYLRTADFNADGRNDLVVSNGLSDSITVLLAQPRRGDFSTFDVRVGQRPTALLARDLNQDDVADILVASLVGADVFVLLGDGRGGFPSQMRFPATWLASAADLADMNADGLPDLALASVKTTRVSIYRNISR